MTCCVQIMPSGFPALPALQPLHAWPAALPSPCRSPRPPSPPASEIIPRLFISDLATAEHAPTLAALGITHVLSAMRGAVALPPGPAHRQLALDDLPFAELAAHLPGTTAWLRAALRDPAARVLVHCGAGVSRSVSVVAAFLVATRAWTPAQALQFVRERRRVADPNAGFVAQLHEYAASLAAGAGAGADAPPRTLSSA